jgi:hypothetical protein
MKFTGWSLCSFGSPANVRPLDGIFAREARAEQTLRELETYI